MKDMTIVPKLYDAILWYAAKLSRYPKAYRYNLGECIMSGFLDVLDLILESRYTSGNKRHLLRQANIRLEKLRYLIRLSKDVRCISLKEYEHAAEMIVEMGRMGDSACASTHTPNCMQHCNTLQMTEALRRPRPSGSYPAHHSQGHALRNSSHPGCLLRQYNKCDLCCRRENAAQMILGRFIVCQVSPTSRRGAVPGAGELRLATA